MKKEVKKYTYPNTTTIRGITDELKDKAKIKSKKEGYNSVSKWIISLITKAVN